MFAWFACIVLWTFNLTSLLHCSWMYYFYVSTGHLQMYKTHFMLAVVWSACLKYFSLGSQFDKTSALFMDVLLLSHAGSSSNLNKVYLGDLGICLVVATLHRVIWKFNQNQPGRPRFLPGLPA